MNILTELNSLLSPIIPVETGVFNDKAPKEYAVLTPLADIFSLYADNRPEFDVQGVRISLFTKGNFIKLKNQITLLILYKDFTITARQYVGYETDTGYYHYNLDVEKHYEMEDLNGDNRIR